MVKIISKNLSVSYPGKMKFLTLVLFILIPGAGISQSMLDKYRGIIEKNTDQHLQPLQLQKISEESGKEIYRISSGPDSIDTSFLILSSAKGRFDYFDYMTVISKNMEISYIKILKYRSEYGYEITNKKWLSQFYNKPQTVFEYRKDIDALTGASFSAPSFVTDINATLKLLEVLR